jgi:hypothetical protein
MSAAMLPRKAQGMAGAGAGGAGAFGSLRIGVDAPLRRKCDCGGSTGAQGECEACKAKRLQRRATGAAPRVVDEALDAPTRAFMEERLGREFSEARVARALGKGLTR